MSRLIAIEGIDGSGKGTQSVRLEQRLRENGYRCRLLSFPRYRDTLFGRAIGEFLDGRFGALDEVNPFLAALLYAGDRFESREVLRESLAENDFVICDRYVPSNAAHQAAKLPESQQHELIEWIERIEFGVYALPQPDLVLLLDLPASEAQKLIAQKQARVYTEKAADLHESDDEYLERVRGVYQRLADRDNRWHTIDCFQQGTLRTADEVSDRIWNVVTIR